ncbi:MAG: hypothetical protein IH948_07250, partial [Bacteroidetes bacterium]|nr:hypothetical protein [Bacteroidota bacterium]
MSSNLFHTKLFKAFIIILFSIVSFEAFAGGGGGESGEVEIVWPDVIMKGFPYEIGIRVTPKKASEIVDGKLTININGKNQVVEIERFRLSTTLGIRTDQLFQGWGYNDWEEEFYEGTFEMTFNETQEVKIEAAGAVFEDTIHPIPPWTSLLPPIVAILMAMWLKEVITSLFMGMFVGVAIIGAYSKGLLGVLSAPLTVLDTYVIHEVFALDKVQIIVFSFFIGATICLVAKSAGMRAMVNKLSKYARNAKSTQLTTALLGFVVFFDDYTTCLINGNTMRRIAMRMRISPEKMAYIVNCTASPVVLMTVVTTWVGFLIACIDSGTSGIEGITEGGYSILIKSLSYSYYQIFALIFLFT